MTASTTNPPAIEPRGTGWIYEGVWGLMTRLFYVPRDPPTLPGGRNVQTFHPAHGFLSYMKLQFWIGVVVVDTAIAIGWIVLTAADYRAGLASLPLALLLIVVPAAVIYLAIHLRYDNTWYLMSDRSLRIRRGIWVIHEMTITFENVQNISISQGPVQRYFGIADLVVETAGSGGGSKEGEMRRISNQGMLEGVANAAELRDRILARLRQSQSVGLGDDNDAVRAAAWSPEHLAVLRDILTELRQDPPDMDHALPLVQPDQIPPPRDT
jgi:membrane protein YdbS with pleckstrin-like domain